MDVSLGIRLACSGKAYTTAALATFTCFYTLKPDAFQNLMVEVIVQDSSWDYGWGSRESTLEGPSDLVKRRCDSPRAFPILAPAARIAI